MSDPFDDFEKYQPDRVEYSGVSETRLMMAWTRSDFFTYDVTNMTDADARRVLLAPMFNKKLTQVGDEDEDASVDSPAVCVARELKPDPISGAGFRMIYQYEKSTGKTIWESFGGIQVELWNYDNDGKLLNVRYTPPGGNGQNPNGAPQPVFVFPGGLKDVPHVPLLPRAILCRVLRRTRIIVASDPNLASDVATKNPTLYANGNNSKDEFASYYGGSVNIESWFDLPPRTVLCGRVNYESQNNYTVREIVEFIIKQRTWDEFASYLSPENKRLPGTTDLPDPDNIATSDVGMRDNPQIGWEVGNIKGDANGMIRAKMNPEVDFNFDFDPYSDDQ